MFTCKVNDGAYTFNAHYFGEHLEDRKKVLSFTERLDEDTRSVYMEKLMPLVELDEGIEKIEVYNGDVLLATYDKYHYVYSLSTDCPEYERAFRGTIVFKENKYS